MNKWLLIALSLSACSKKADAPAGGGGDGMKTPKEFAAWTPKDAATLWQGAWTTRLNPLHASKRKSTSMAGDAMALEVKDRKATAWDGTVEVTMDFSVRSPCEARFAEPITEGSMKGGHSYHDVIFVVQSGAVVPGSGAAGYRKGKTAVVCAPPKGGAQFSERFDL